MEATDTCYLQAARTLPAAAEEAPLTTFGIPSPLPSLTAFTEGWSSGDFVVLSGEHGTGKTTFAVASTAEALRTHHSVLFISPELSKEEIASRVLSSLAGVTPQEFTYSPRTERQAAAMAKAETLLATANFAALTTDSLAMMKEVMKALSNTPAGLSLVVIDGLESLWQRAHLQDESSLLARTLRELATSLQVTILVTTAAPRAARLQKLPSVAACGGGVDLLASVDFALLLTNHSWDRGEPEAYRKVDLTLLKNRRGAVGVSFSCYLNPLHLRFQEEAW
jgi:replicative DNA helicase